MSQQPIEHPGPWRHVPIAGGLVTTYAIKDRNGDIVAKGIDEVRIAEFFAEMWDEWEAWGDAAP